MEDNNDIEYFSRRAETAKRAAEKASDPIAKRIHDTMADQYDAIVGQLSGKAASQIAR